MTIVPADGAADDAPPDWLPDAAQSVGAAVQAILAANRRHEPIDELARQAAGFAADPPVVGVRSVAKAYGLDSTVRRCAGTDVAQLSPPFVAIVDGDPHGVITAGDRDALRPDGPVEVVTFSPSREFLADEHALSDTSLLRRRMRVARSGYLLAILAGVLLAIPGIVVSGLAKTFVNKYLVDGSTQWLEAVLIGLLLSAILQAGLGWLQQSTTTRISRKLSISMSADYLWHLLRLPMSHFVARPAGDLAFLMTRNDKVASKLGRNLTAALMSIVLALINGAFLFRYSRLLTVVVLCISLVSTVVVRVISKRLTALKRDWTEAQGLARSTTTTGIASIESLKANGAEEALYTRWAAHYERSVAVDQRMSVIGVYMGAVPDLSTWLTITAVIGVGGAQVISGAMSLGDLVGFQSLLFPFMFAIGTVIGSFTLLNSMVADCRTLDKTYRASIDLGAAAIESVSPVSEPRKLAGSLELRDLSFGYQPGGPRLIDDLSFRVEPGARIALVGGSGSGKSTVARLITGQLDPWGGEVLFDGRPRHAHPQGELAHSMAFVQQDIYLFDGTVAENLTMWDPTISESDYIRAAKDACIHDEIKAFPGGYESRILEGGRNLSGGQRQRIEIARALTRNPRLVILDEATSALDAVSESIVDANLRRRGVTCVIVAHRLSTIRDCDEIIVLDHGKVVERGTHETLLAAGGEYAHLVGDMA